MASKAAPLMKASSGSLNTLQQGNLEDNQAFDGWKIEGPWKMRMDGREGKDEDIPRVSKSASACLSSEVQVQGHLKRNINLIFFLSPACSFTSLSLQIVSSSDQLLQTDVSANPAEQLLEVAEPSLLGEQGGHSKKSLQVLLMGVL